MIPAGSMKGGLCLRHYSSMSDTVVSTSKQKPAALKRPASVRDVVKKLQKKGIHVPKDVKVPVPKIVTKKPAKRSK